MAKSKMNVQPEPQLPVPILEECPPEPLLEALKTSDEIVQSAPDAVTMRTQIEELTKANAHKNLFGDRLSTIYEMLADGNSDRAKTMLEEAMNLLASYTDEVKRLATSSEALEQATREVKASYEDVVRILQTRASEPVDVSWREGFLRIEKLENLLHQLDESTASGFVGFTTSTQKQETLQVQIGEIEEKLEHSGKRNEELDSLQKRVAEIAQQQKANDQNSIIKELQESLDKLSARVYELDKKQSEVNQ